MDYSWLDRSAYPFTHRTLEVAGGPMHYLDEGAGEPILFIHGSSAWSFAYRHLIGELRERYRCIAPDHLGFGLSAKPANWEYGFAEQSRNLSALLDHLGLERVTLVIHDIGGPIGLGAALAKPERIARLLVLNTFGWSLAGRFALAPAPLAALLRGPIGRYAIQRLNTELRLLIPLVYGDRAKLTPAIFRHYLEPLARSEDRHGLFATAQQVFAPSGWCDDVWAQRATLAAIPSAIVWGMRDPLFGQKFLNRWREALPNATVTEVPTAGHFVQEEAPEAVSAALRSLLARP